MTLVTPKNDVAETKPIQEPVKKQVLPKKIITETRSIEERLSKLVIYEVKGASEWCIVDHLSMYPFLGFELFLGKLYTGKKIPLQKTEFTSCVLIKKRLGAGAAVITHQTFTLMWKPNANGTVNKLFDSHMFSILESLGMAQPKEIKTNSAKLYPIVERAYEMLVGKNNNWLRPALKQYNKVSKGGRGEVGIGTRVLNSKGKQEMVDTTPINDEYLLS